MSQLKMLLNVPTDYVVPELPEGYTLTTMQDTEADIRGWLKTCEEGLSFTASWTVEDVRKNMFETEGLCPEQVFVIRDPQGEIVATAAAWLLSGNRGSLHMVSARPEARGKNLGAIVVKAVMDFFKPYNLSEVWLSTDDFRLGAIKTYLRQGFLPNLYESDMEERWRAIYKILDVNYPVYYHRIELGELK